MSVPRSSTLRTRTPPPERPTVRRSTQGPSYAGAIAAPPPPHPITDAHRPDRRRRARRAATALVALATITLASACSDLLDTNSADAVVQIEADDQSQVLLTRQEVLASASTWGGTRVGEQTTGADETALEFTLPGSNLEIALAAIGDLDARVVATTIDVDAAQIERAPTTTRPGDEPADPSETQVRLRVEVTEAAPAGAGAVVQLIMAVFSVIGMVATVGWVLRWWRRRGERTVPPRRNIDRVDLRDDPPTQETPRVPPQW